MTRDHDRTEWRAGGAVVACAMTLHGLWQIVDARGHPVVSLIPAGPEDRSGPPGISLVAPTAHVVGTIYRVPDPTGAVVEVIDARGERVLVLRDDAVAGIRMVDAQGEVVALESPGSTETTTDLLVTTSGTRHALALVFGLLLAHHIERQPGPRPS